MPSQKASRFIVTVTNPAGLVDYVSRGFKNGVATDSDRRFAKVYKSRAGANRAKAAAESTISRFATPDGYTAEVVPA